jgi:hypothetical protein
MALEDPPSQPTAASPSTAGTPPASEPHRRPTLWIALTVLFALVAVGLGAWALSERSDANDAQAKLDAQASAAEAGATPAASATPSSTVNQVFATIETELGLSGENVDQIKASIDKAQANVDNAQKAKADATNAIDRLKAEAQSITASAEKTRACLRGAVDSLKQAVQSGGVEAGVAELQSLAGSCRSEAAG